MPVLMIALLALAVFGGIGILLAAAVILEHRSKVLHDTNEPGRLGQESTQYERRRVIVGSRKAEKGLRLAHRTVIPSPMSRAVDTGCFVLTSLPIRVRLRSDRQRVPARKLFTAVEKGCFLRCGSPIRGDLGLSHGSPTHFAARRF